MFEFGEIVELKVGSRRREELLLIGESVGEDDVDSFEGFFDRSDVVVVSFAELHVGDSVEESLGGSGVG